MSCKASIKSPITGNTVLSTTYFQLTNLFDKQKAVDVYNSMYTPGFKDLLGFDWTTNTEHREELNLSGEPRIEYLNKILDLDLSQYEIDSINSQEDILSQLDPTQEFDSFEEASMAAAEFNMNPRYKNVNTDVVRTDNGFRLAVGRNQVSQNVTKETLSALGFGTLVTQFFPSTNSSWSDVVNGLLTSDQLPEFQKNILSKLVELQTKNGRVKLVIFDDTEGLDPGQVAFYDNSTGTVYIGKTISESMDNSKLVRDIIHESLHAYTIKALNEPVTEQEKAFKAEMEKIFNSYLKKFPNLAVNYGFKNVEEFVSEVMSNPHFRAALTTQQEFLKNDKNFLANFLEKIGNFFKGLYTDLPTVNEIDQTINDYIDNLVETGDMPLTQGEYDLRFRNEKYNAQGQTDLERFPELEKFVEFIEKNSSTNMWSQITQSLKEIDSTLRNTGRLQERFSDINALDAKTILANTISYLNSAFSTLKTVQNQLELYRNNIQEFEDFAIIKTFNYAKNLSGVIKQQIDVFESELNQLFDVSEIVDLQDRATTTEALERAIPDFETVVRELRDALTKSRSLANSIESDYNNYVLAPIARELASSFGESATAEGKKQTQEMINALTNARDQARAKGKTKLAESLTQEIKDLQQLQSFIPTAKNIEALLKNDKKLGKETSMLGMWINNAVQGKNPTVQIIKQFIDKAAAEAGIESGKFSKRAQDIFDKLRKLRGKLATEILTFQSLYKGYTREIEVLHKQPDGSLKKVKQAVLNTKLKEEEFQSDLKLLLQKEEEAFKTGDQAIIDQAKEDTNKFLEDYALAPYTDEYYKIQSLLTEEAKEAREAYLKEINYLSEDSDPDEGTRAAIKEQLTEFARLGSIYFVNGDEKPVGSKERRIAESIIAWKKERNNKDVLTYDNTVKRKQWQIKKNQVDDEYSKILKRKNAADISLSMAAFTGQSVEDLAEANKKITEEYEEAKKARDEWYEQNTRVELTPEFFREQTAITEAINSIYSRYASTESTDLTDLYTKLFNAVLGFRDADGVIQANDVTNAGSLFPTIKQLEEQIDKAKEEVNANREISEDDKTELGRLVKMLGGLQSRKETSYYTEKVAEVKGSIRADLMQDADYMSKIEAEAETRRNTYLAAKLITVFTTLHEIKQAMLEEKVEDLYRQSQWFKDNHITTQETRNVDGDQVTATKQRPSYIWTQTIPNDPRHINQESPSFQWSVPVIDDIFKNKDYKFTTEPRPRETSDGKYSNPEYTKLSLEERSILDDIITLHEDVQKELPKSQRIGYAIVNEGRGAFEATSTVLRRPLNTFSGILELIKLTFVPNIGSAEYEQVDESQTTTIQGRKVQLIRNRYKTPLNSNQVSYNILGNIAKFGVYSSHFAAMQKIMPTVFSAREAIQKGESAESTLSTIDFEISKNFYGEEIASTFKNKYIRGALRPANKFVSVGQRKALQFNIVSSLKNFSVNTWNAGINRNLAGVSRVEFFQGMLRSIKQSDKLFDIYRGGGNVSYYADLLMHFQAFSNAQPKNKADNIHQTMLNRYVSSETAGFIMRGYLENISTGAVFESIINQYNVTIDEGGVKRTIKLAEAYEQKDGKLQLKSGVEVKDINRLEQEIRDRIFNFQTTSQGNYYKRGSTKHERYLVMRIIMSMKRWVATTFNNKYGSRRIQLNTGNIEKGFNREILGYTKLLVAGGFSMASETTTDQQKSRMKTAAVNLVAMLAVQQALISTMGIIAHSLDGDDDDNTSPVLAFVANLLQGIHDELSTFSPIGVANWAYRAFFQTPAKSPGESNTVARGKQLAWSIAGGTLKSSYDAISPLLDGDTWKDPMGSFSYKYSNGFPNEFSTPKALYGKPKLLAAFMVYSGVETGMSQFMQPGKKLFSVLKFNPRLDITEERRIKLDPLGSYNQLSEKITEIKKELKQVDNNQITDPKERQAKIAEILEAEKTMENIGKQYPYVDAYYKNRKFATSTGSKAGSELDKEIKLYIMQTNPDNYIKKMIKSKRQSLNNKLKYRDLKSENLKGKHLKNGTQEDNALGD